MPSQTKVELLAAVQMLYGFIKPLNFSEQDWDEEGRWMDRMVEHSNTYATMVIMALQNTIYRMNKAEVMKYPFSIYSETDKQITVRYGDFEMILEKHTGNTHFLCEVSKLMNVPNTIWYLPDFREALIKRAEEILMREE
jgi:hypothetical protein